MERKAKHRSKTRSVLEACIWR